MSQEPPNNPDIDPEGPEPEEMDLHEEPDLMPCPHCRKMITEEAERCHHCGQYVEALPLASRLSLATVFIVCLLVILLAGGLILVVWR